MNSPQSIHRRSWVVVLLLGLGIVGLIIQLVRVQFGPYAPIFQSMALNDVGLLERLLPQRGKIFDRNGQLLATNASEFFLEIETIQLTEQSSKDIASVV